MDLVDQMKTFVRIVEAGSLSAAARGRRLSLAAVSRQLGALEEELDAELVVRTTRRLQVTTSGRRWYEHCVRMLRELDAAKADVSDRGGVRGRVTLSVPITFGQVFVVPRLERLARAHPELEIDLRIEDHVIDLVAEGVDLAVRGGVAPPDSTAFVAHPLTEFRRVVVASPAYLRRAGTPRHPSDLERHDGLVQRGLSSTFTRWRFERDGEVVEAIPRPRMSATAPIVLRDWALAGGGIAMLPEWLVAGQPLRHLCEGWETPVIRMWALYRSEQRGVPRIRAVLDALD